MRVELSNVLEGCPNDCCDFKFEHCLYLPTVAQKADWDLRVVVDCTHSGVCKFRKEKEDDE